MLHRSPRASPPLHSAAAAQIDFRTSTGGAVASRREFALRFPPQGLGAARRLRSHYDRLSTRAKGVLRQPLRWTPTRVKLRDKAAFVLGVSHLTISAYWLGNSPSTFYQLYTVKAALLLGLRLVLYRRQKMHYYLLDFCYYANALMLLHAWALPELCALRRILFAFSMGPLAWSIILFRNSMIFHSLDKARPALLLRRRGGCGFRHCCVPAQASSRAVGDTLSVSGASCASCRLAST